MSRDLAPDTPQSVGLSPEGLADVDAALQALVDQGVLAGAATLVARHGKRVHLNAFGKKNLETGEAVSPDTVFRIYSMTKPVTGVAMMILYDQGLWRPEDPIAKHLPSFADMKVFKELGADGKPLLEDAASPPTMAQLMTHTAGLSYGFNPEDPLDKLYQDAHVWQSDSLAQFADKVAALPLAYHPGDKWIYSLSMDIQGAIIEKLSGQSLPDFMYDRIFAPLGMVDTAFFVSPVQKPRLATLYRKSKTRGLVPMARPLFAETDGNPPVPSGGGGLTSTIGDYARFAQMLLNEGEFGGVRILSPEAVKLQTANHLAPHLMTGEFGIGHQAVRPGFGYGFDGAVFTDPALAGIPVGKGTYQWDGAAGTWFWVDPANDLIFVGMIQLMAEDSPPCQAMTQTLLAKAIVG